MATCDIYCDIMFRIIYMYSRIYDSLDFAKNTQIIHWTTFASKLSDCDNGT